MYKVLAFYIVLYDSRVISYLFCSPARFLLVRTFTSLRFTLSFRVCHHPSDYMTQKQPLSRARGTEWRPACLTSCVCRAIRNSVPNPPPPTLLLSLYTGTGTIEVSGYPRTPTDSSRHKSNRTNGQMRQEWQTNSYCPILQWHRIFIFWRSPNV